VSGARRRLHSVFAALALTLILASAAHAQLYRWTDEKGETHFGQGIESVPERYRGRAGAVGSVEPPQVPSGPVVATVSEGVTRIAFAPGRSINLTVKINGRPMWLLLDTGATRTAISPTALFGLGVSYRDAPRVQVRGFTGTATGYIVTLESVEVGGARVGPLRVLSHDIQLSDGRVGVLGMDFLNHFRVTIDNARGVVELVPK
jgi:predicted aspartyl protease